MNYLVHECFKCKLEGPKSDPCVDMTKMVDCRDGVKEHHVLHAQELIGYKGLQMHVPQTYETDKKFSQEQKNTQDLCKRYDEDFQQKLEFVFEELHNQKEKYMSKLDELKCVLILQYK